MRRYPTRSNPGATVVSGGSVSPVLLMREKQEIHPYSPTHALSLKKEPESSSLTFRCQDSKKHVLLESVVIGQKDDVIIRPLCHVLPMGTSQEMTNCRS